MIKFTQEEKELVAGMLSSGEWRTVEKACSMVVERLQIDLINSNIRDSDRDLVLRKAKLDGARDVAAFLNNIKKQLIKEGLD